MSNGGAGHLDFELSEADCRRLSESGINLSAADLEKVRRAIVSFIRSEVHERNAPFTDDVLDIVGEVRRAAVEFGRTLELRGSGGPDKTAEAASIEIETRLNDYTNISTENTNVMERIRVLSSELIQVCRMIDEEKREAPGFVVGDAWDDLIKRLTKIVKEANFSTAASNDGRITHFVSFVSVVHTLIPNDIPRDGVASPQALAKAILRARTRSQRNPEPDLPLIEGHGTDFWDPAE